MKIALDARTVYGPQRRGTGKNLIDLYRHVAGMRPAWQFVMFHRGCGRDDPFAGLANVTNQVIECPGDRWDLWQQVRLPLAARAVGADLLHCPANTAPRWPLTPMVLTVHDVIPVAMPDEYPHWRRWRRKAARAAAKARIIVTPSEYSRLQIVEALGVSADKVRVNPWAPDEHCRRVTAAAAIASAARQYGLDAARPYVLCFAAAEPRKNTARVLCAWSLLDESLRGRYQLLLVGLAPGSLAGFRARADALGIGGSCVPTGFADENDLPALLSGAAALCYPSLCEGFGLPVLDAFACGTPVLTSATTSLPEVAGDAAVLVDPAEAKAIAEGLKRLLTDGRLRSELADRGMRRAAQFTWPACAERMCAVFEKAYEGPKSDQLG